MSKKLDPSGRTWRRLAQQEALSFCPTIYPCQKCSYPVVDGYCCNKCGTGDPRTNENGEKLWEIQGYI